MLNIKTVISQLKNLPNKYRSTPFWAWNERMNNNSEITKQITSMKQEGVGGFFIHSREGLETPYLSKEWMMAVNHTVEHAKEEGMDVWIYDEDKWPSGSAGGRVSQINPEQFTAKALTVEKVPIEDVDMHKDHTILKAISIDANTFVLFRIEQSKTSEWYNGFAPTDVLNPEAIQAFINLTHEQYKTQLGEEFVRNIKGFFTDEPNFCDFFSAFSEGRPWLPWTLGFEDYFEEKRGYQLLDQLGSLFFKINDYQKIRHDYWLTLTELFMASYSKQLYSWCENNHLKMTGHMLYENDLGYSVRVSGASMPHYQYMHLPGIDILGEQIDEYLTVKQCTSVANQFKREHVVTETYGCTGWDFSFLGQKWLGDWQFVMGVNRRCQHLALYSIAGCRKRDYPPSFNYNTSWWEFNHLLEDYFARLSCCVSNGEIKRDILVLHPMSTFWMASGSTINEDFNNIEMNMGWKDQHIVGLNEKGNTYNQFAKELLMAQHDFDFGDEIIMRDHAVVVLDKIKVEQHEYQLLIVPKIKTLMGSTLQLIKKFLEKGGKVLWIGPIVSRIDGESSNEAFRLQTYSQLHQVSTYGEALSVLDKLNERSVRITDQFGKDESDFLSMVRAVDDGWIITVVHTNKEKPKQVYIEFAVFGAVDEFCPLTNKRYEVKVEVIEIERTKKSKMVYSKYFEKAETKVYFVYRNKEPKYKKNVKPYKHPHASDKVLACLGPTARISTTMENSLILDRCQFQMSNNSWSDIIEVWKGQKDIREKMNFQQVYYNGAPQRYSWVESQKSKGTKQLKMRFEFYIEDIPQESIFVAVEKAETYEIYCNGHKCIKTDAYFLDRSMNKRQIPIIQKGANIIDIHCDYHAGIELEDIYILGEFGVNCSREIVDKPTSLQFKDWCLQGLYHYAGNVIYHFDIDFESNPIPEEINHIFMNIKEIKGTLGIVRINDGPNTYFLHGHSKIDITQGIFNHKKNKIEIEIVGSPRNIFGPFHQGYTDCSRISWEDFRTEDIFYTEDYVVEAYGILDQIIVSGE